MPMKVLRRLRELPLIVKFNLITLAILLVGCAAVGWWISNQIETRVLQRSGHTTSLFVGSVFAPVVEELLSSPETFDSQTLDTVLDQTNLNDSIVAFKIWDQRGTVVHSSNPAEIGLRYEIESGLELAWSGQISTEISELDRAEHTEQRRHGERLLETYAPVRETGTGRILAVLEFYQTITDLEREIRIARLYSWVIVTSLVAGIYLSLVLLVRAGNRTIIQQRNSLEDQVEEYRRLAQRNAGLERRLRSAAIRTTALNEEYLRRIAAELHDGPAQDIGYALLKHREDPATGKGVGTQENLKRALDEIRAISAGLRSPELASLTVQDTVQRAVRGHNSRSGQNVAATCVNLPTDAPLAVKITAFRVIQEALSNASRHSTDESPTVAAKGEHDAIRVTVSDRGPGFDVTRFGDGTHLGLSVMRERVELLGGEFQIESHPASGTVVSAVMPLETERRTDHE